jgi:hypothetical protein
MRVPFSPYTRAFAAVAFSCVALQPVRAQAPILMNYSDVTELNAALDWLSGSAHAQVMTIGHSIDYKTDPRRPVIHPIKAIRISASTDEGITDDVRKNAILFECGSHPREWLATESCLTLATHLVLNAEDETTEVPELLGNVDVWIVPLTTPAGRAIDDTRGGDPRFFDRSVSGAGWRGNGDTRGGCTRGVNVARNFSSDWNGEPSADCTGDAGSLGNYRGFAPFSTLEATALRNFVQNHSISMAVVIHSNAQKISNLWGPADIGGTQIADLGKLAWDLFLDDPNLVLTRSRSLGSGLGQFSAWLAAPSDTAGQPDLGSARAIQTIFVELPFLDADLDDDVPVDAYNLGDYRYEADDAENRSNGFHPSSSRPVRRLIETNFLFMAEELIREARSPGCSVLGGCPTADFGLVGAKIGRSSLGAGALQTNSAGCLATLEDGLCSRAPVAARDYLAARSYYLDYRVQNFGTRVANNDVSVRMTIDETINTPDGRLTNRSTSTETFLNLPLREARTGRFAVNVIAGADYTVTLQIIPASLSIDRFAMNDVKVFKFRGR